MLKCVGRDLHVKIWWTSRKKNTKMLGHLIFFKCIAELLRNKGNPPMSKMTGKHESREVIKHEPDSRQRASTNLWYIRAVGLNGHHA